VTILGGGRAYVSSSSSNGGSLYQKKSVSIFHLKKLHTGFWS
jgi:hypothetical protein